MGKPTNEPLEFLSKCAKEIKPHFHQTPPVLVFVTHVRIEEVGNLLERVGCGENLIRIALQWLLIILAVRCWGTRRFQRHTAGTNKILLPNLRTQKKCNTQAPNPTPPASP